MSNSRFLKCWHITSSICCFYYFGATLLSKLAKAANAGCDVPTFRESGIWHDRFHLSCTNRESCEWLRTTIDSLVLRQEGDTQLAVQLCREQGCESRITSLSASSRLCCSCTEPFICLRSAYFILCTVWFAIISNEKCDAYSDKKICCRRDSARRRTLLCKVTDFDHIESPYESSN